MDIDYAYIKQILSEIKEAQKPYADSKTIYSKYLDADDSSKVKFIFHWHLIIENGLVSTNKKPIYDLESGGLIASPQDPMQFMFVCPPIRLTNLGIELLSSLEEPRVLDVIVDKFKGEGFSAVIDISKQLGLKFLNKKLESIDF
ncbi:DUF2513 domain-containing protein [Vibrio hyugaensis]|uniref:DUF2513 domain-containing protein n=1 Tax=Vibrio hyugaensis TaxID=1534743 RepID=UPI0005EF495A|nr:DUF2513 domain-containing protein [Vibrio hyugaensis]